MAFMTSLFRKKVVKNVPVYTQIHTYLHVVLFLTLKSSTFFFKIEVRGGCYVVLARLSHKKYT